MGIGSAYILALTGQAMIAVNRLPRAVNLSDYRPLGDIEIQGSASYVLYKGVGAQEGQERQGLPQVFLFGMYRRNRHRYIPSDSAGVKTDTEKA